jgi:hypothetical protein
VPHGKPASRTRRRPTRRAPISKPQSAIAHGDPLAEPNALAGDVMLLCLAGIGRTQRSAGDQPGQTKSAWKCADAASLAFRPHSVHQFHLGRIAATSAVHSDFLPSRNLQAFRARQHASVNAHKALNLGLLAVVLSLCVAPDVGGVGLAGVWSVA